MSIESENAVHKGRIKCMEVWGGTHAIDTVLSIPGVQTQVISQPYRGEANGGDIHYVSLCGHGMLSRFLVADVSGHGQVVSELAGELRGLMARYVQTLDQTELVCHLNDEFAVLSQDGSFATAVVATYFTQDRCLTLCNAGHPYPLWPGISCTTRRPARTTRSTTCRWGCWSGPTTRSSPFSLTPRTWS